MYAAPIDIELSDAELALLLQAIEDGIAYRDARSHLVQSAVRRRDRRTQVPASREMEAGAAHRELARDYQALARKLKTRSA